MACPTCSLIPTKRLCQLASSSLKYTGSHHRKLRRRGLISGVEPVSISIGVRQLRNAEAVKFKTKQTYIKARSQVVGGSCAVHNSVRHLFDILGLAFSWILMLLMGFTLPIANNEGPEDILDSAADFDLGRVADKLGGGATASNHIQLGVDKCLFGFQGMYITDSGGKANEKLGNGHTRVNCRDIGIHNAGGKCFFTAVDIQCGEWQFEVLLENCTHWHPGILGGIIEGLFDNILRKPGKFVA
jgi:hypothetical protein